MIESGGRAEGRWGEGGENEWERVTTRAAPGVGLGQTARMWELSSGTSLRTFEQSVAVTAMSVYVRVWDGSEEAARGEVPPVAGKAYLEVGRLPSLGSSLGSSKSAGSRRPGHRCVRADRGRTG